MMQTMRQNLEADRPAVDAAPQHELRYARKTYRYLRVAIVSMVVTLLVCTVLQSVDAGSWLGSLSAYYFTPVHAIFIGSLIMIGICLIAIRGQTNPEDITLNIAGLCAPIVALVPTAMPDEPGYKNLFEGELPLAAMQFNNVIALGLTAVFAVALAFTIGSRGRLSAVLKALTTETRIGFGLTGLTIAVLVGVHLFGGPQWTHNTSAGMLIVGLLFVAIINSVRNLRDSSGRQSWGHQLGVGFAGAALLFGATLAAVGVLRLIAGEGSVVLVLGLAVVGTTLVVTTTLGWPSALAWFQPQADQRSGYEQAYFAVAVAMVVGGPLLGLWPGDFEHRTLWVELVELIPFGVFWIIQTAENWDESDPVSAQT